MGCFYQCILTKLSKCTVSFQVQLTIGHNCFYKTFCPDKLCASFVFLLHYSICSPQTISPFFQFTSLLKLNLLPNCTVAAHKYSSLYLPLLNTRWLGHGCICTQWETWVHVVSHHINGIQRLHLRAGGCWRRFAPSWRGSSPPRVPSTQPSRGVSHSAATELRRIRAAGVRWAWRGSSHPETTDYFTGTKLC